MKMFYTFLTATLLMSSSAFALSCKNTYLHSKPKLFVISAPSGGGKTTLVKRFLEDHTSEFLQSVSLTTRNPRVGEVPGKDYHFLTRSEFESRLQSSEFLEYAEVHGNFYGTSKTQIDQALAEGKSVFLLIDVQGASQIKKIYGTQAQLIFIKPPNMAVLEQRLRGRNTDSEEVISRRLKNAHHELTFEKDFEVTLINDNLDQAYRDLVETIFNNFKN